VAAEGGAGLPKRDASWRIANGYGPGDVIDVHFITEPLNLFAGDDTDRLICAIRGMRRAPILVVFDTLARSMLGGDENSSKDVGVVIGNAGRIQRETGAAVLFVHHSRKDGEVERGSSALRGAADVMMQIKVEEDRRLLVCEKVKDAPPFPPSTIELVPLGDSCVVQTASFRRDSEESSLTEKHIASLTALAECSLGSTATGPTWQEQAGVSRAAFYRIVSYLKKEGYVNMRERGNSKLYALTESGRAALSQQSHPSLKPVSPLKPDQSHQSLSPLRAETVETETRELELGVSRGEP